MGNKSSHEVVTRVDKRAEKARCKEVAQQVIFQRKAEIESVQQQLLENVQNQSGASNSNVNVKETIMITEHAKSQLDRGGKPFNKMDLITIILAIDPNQMTHMNRLESLRIEDLNALIRTLIYDVNRFISKPETAIKPEVVARKSPLQEESNALILSPSEEKRVIVPQKKLQRENAMILFQRI